jgi:hypothetical protein
MGNGKLGIRSYQLSWEVRLNKSLPAAALFLVGCSVSSSSQTPWSEVKNRLIGKPYEEVVACAGIPDNLTTVTEGTGAVLYRQSITGGFTCDSTMMIKAGTVVSVTEREIPSTDEKIHIPPDSVMWPNYTLCSKRFENCTWRR